MSAFTLAWRIKSLLNVTAGPGAFLHVRLCPNFFCCCQAEHTSLHICYTVTDACLGSFQKFCSNLKQEFIKQLCMKLKQQLLQPGILMWYNPEVDQFDSHMLNWVCCDWTQTPHIAWCCVMGRCVFTTTASVALSHVASLQIPPFNYDIPPFPSSKPFR